ncbi:MAG: nucleotide sugar dehydrogenase [Planctomycetes bacterium]|nr:nucleotide sugar dehydrogenase [Planctomycetota bacterium]
MSGELLDRIEKREIRVGVIGLGYVGLPLVREFVSAGFRVVGFDIDRAKIGALQAGKSYIKHIGSDLVSRIVGSGEFQPTTDFDRLSEVEAIVICVPTPLTAHREPDTSYIESTARSIAPRLKRGQLVVLESTTYPGTTRELVLPILEATGLLVEEDFLLAFSPEREDPGNPKHSTRTIPKVVGGIGPRSAEAAELLYGQVVVRVVPVSSAEAAEATKILENIYRSVNIALVNELKLLFLKMGIDIWEVIEAASTKPFGFQPFWPGPGLGGHCIPIDPFYLTWKAREYGFPTRFIELAGEINTSMPGHVVRSVSEALNEEGRSVRGADVLVLGIAYKKDVDDPRESPAFEVIELLRELGARVRYHDPHVPRLPRMRAHDIEMSAVELTPESLAAADCVLLVTDHSAYDYPWIAEHSRLVVDTRNAFAKVREPKARIVKA